MELGETVAEARETNEEAGALIEMQDLFSMLTVVRVGQVHLFYRARLLSDRFDPGHETMEARLFSESEIPWDEIAFRTVRETLERYFFRPPHWHLRPALRFSTSPEPYSPRQLLPCWASRRRRSISRRSTQIGWFWNTGLAHCSAMQNWKPSNMRPSQASLGLAGLTTTGGACVVVATGGLGASSAAGAGVEGGVAGAGAEDL